jgi:hypothetical protein
MESMHILGSRLEVRITFKHTRVVILHEELEAGAVFNTIDLTVRPRTS